MVKAGVWAEKLNHHPEWSNVYKTVNVLLTTHDKGCITNLDVRLAQEMDKLYESWSFSRTASALDPVTTPEASSR